MDCPICGEPDMMFLEGIEYEDGYVEPDAFECPDCGHMEVLER